MASRASTGWRWPWRTLALVGVTVSGFVALGASGWPGEPSPCAVTACWCETPRAGAVGEVWNTWSNLPALVAAVGLAGWQRGRAAIRGAFVYALWAAGAGALFFHGSLTAWSQSLDRTSILMVWTAVLSTSFVRLGWVGLARLPVAVALGSVAAAVYILGLGLNIDVGGLSCLATFLVLEVVLRVRDGTPADPRWFRGAAVAFAVALVAWALSRPSSPLCDGPVPSHAIWHVAVALALTGLGVHAAGAPLGADADEP